MREDGPVEVPTTEDDSEMVVVSIQRALLRCAFTAGIGSIPGGVAMFAGEHRMGVMLATFGGFIGACMGLPGMSLVRVLKLLVAVLVSYNVPGLKHRTYEWADESPTASNQRVAGSMELMEWVFGFNIQSPRRWLILTALSIGMLVGAIIHVHDVLEVNAGKPGLILPWQHSKDSLEIQAVMGTLAFAIWTAVATATIAAPAFGRPLVGAILFTSIWSAAIGYAASQPNSPSLVNGVLFFATAAAGAVILILCICHGPEDADEVESSD